MTKAQEVRGKRLEKRQSDLTTRAEKVFYWILDLMDADTEKGYYGSFMVCLFDGQEQIKSSTLNGKKYDLHEDLLKFDRLEFFSKLEEIIDREEGYKAILKPFTTFYDSKAILLEIVIE